MTVHELIGDRASSEGSRGDGGSLHLSSESTRLHQLHQLHPNAREQISFSSDGQFIRENAALKPSVHDSPSQKGALGHQS
jgi:hypothetical protein